MATYLSLRENGYSVKNTEYSRRQALYNTSMIHERESIIHGMLCAGEWHELILDDLVNYIGMDTVEHYMQYATLKRKHGYFEGRKEGMTNLEALRIQDKETIAALQYENNNLKEKLKNFEEQLNILRTQVCFLNNEPNNRSRKKHPSIPRRQRRLHEIK